jgi:hypothetical protein
MIPLGATLINNSHLTSEQTSGLIIAEVKRKLSLKDEATKQFSEAGPTPG